MRAYTVVDGAWKARGRPSIVPDGFVLATTRPDATNTGALAGTTFQTYSGPANITTDGATFRDTLFPNKVSIQAKNVTIEGCKGTAVIDGLIHAGNSNVRNLLVRRTTLRPASGSTVSIGIVGHDFTIERCDISGTVDGIRVHNTSAPVGQSGVRIIGNYIHDLCYTTPYSGHSDNETHNDGIQIEGGNGVEVIGNRIAAYGDPVYGNIADNPRGPQVLSCIIVTPNVGDVHGLRIVGNWFEGAYVPINLSEKNRGPLLDLFVQGNRWDGNKRLTWDVLMHGTTKDANNMTLWTDNIRTDTGNPVVFTG